MDKLQPVIKHHFWILLVPVLAMNLWGYFSANSALKAATADREKKLDSVKSGIPAGASDPNKKYAEELSQRNEILEKYVDEELLDLWNRQKKRMVWPASVAPSIPKLYRGEIADRKVRFAYQKDYPELIRKLHASVEPYVLDKRGISWTPKVDFPIQLIPQIAIGDLAIESEQMWNVQEDIWMTEFILDAIRQMNKDADSETSSVIRRVISYRLLGGDGTPVLADAGGSGEESSSDMGGVEMSRRMSAPMGNGGNQGAGGAQGSRITSSVRFDPAEEFGPGGEPDPAMGNGGASNMMMSSSRDSMMDAGAEEEGEEPAGPLRYVGTQGDDIPFVERGFYLSVIINQNKVVDFLVALSNSEWPVRIVRFQLGRNPYAQDPFSARAVGGSGGGIPGMRGPRGGNSSMRPGMSMMPNSGGSDGMLGSVMSSRGSMGARGAMGMQGAGTFNTGFPEDALQHPDLIQLDLAGLITMFKQPESEKPKEASEGGADESSGDGAPSAEGDSEGATADANEMPADEAGSVEGGVEATSENVDAASMDPDAPPVETTDGALTGDGEAPLSGAEAPSATEADAGEANAQPDSDFPAESVPAANDDFPEPANPEPMNDAAPPADEVPPATEETPPGEPAVGETPPAPE